MLATCGVLGTILISHSRRDVNTLETFQRKSTTEPRGTCTLFVESGITSGQYGEQGSWNMQSISYLECAVYLRIYQRLDRWYVSAEIKLDKM